MFSCDNHVLLCSSSHLQIFNERILSEIWVNDWEKTSTTQCLIADFQKGQRSRVEGFSFFTLKTASSLAVLLLLDYCLPNVVCTLAPNWWNLGRTHIGTIFLKSACLVWNFQCILLDFGPGNFIWGGGGISLPKTPFWGSLICVCACVVRVRGRGQKARISLIFKLCVVDRGSGNLVCAKIQ